MDQLWNFRRPDLCLQPLRSCITYNNWATRPGAEQLSVAQETPPSSSITRSPSSAESSFTGHRTNEVNLATSSQLQYCPCACEGNSERMPYATCQGTATLPLATENLFPARDDCCHRRNVERTKCCLFNNIGQNNEISNCADFIKTESLIRPSLVSSASIETTPEQGTSGGSIDHSYQVYANSQWSSYRIPSYQKSATLPASYMDEGLFDHHHYEVHSSEIAHFVGEKRPSAYTAGIYGEDEVIGNSATSLETSAENFHLQKHDANLVADWLCENYESSTRDDTCIARDTVFHHYLISCYELKMLPVNKASFGKLLHRQFPGLKIRRLGPRGSSRYHYCGLRVKQTSYFFTRNCTRSYVRCLPI